jgi:hypothetical protein
MITDDSLRIAQEDVRDPGPPAAGLAAGGPGQGIRSYAGMVRNST